MNNYDIPNNPNYQYDEESTFPKEQVLIKVFLVYSRLYDIF